MKLINDFTARPLAGMVLAMVTFFPVFSHASGGGIGSNQDGYSKKVDQLYEKGKSYFHSSYVDGKRVEYCVTEKDSPKKISRKSLKRFHATSPDMLMAQLVHCDDPGQLVSAEVPRNQIDAIVYYLNKRYRLSLYGNS